MKSFEVGQAVFIRPEYGDGDAEAARVAAVSPKGRSITVVYTADGRRRSFPHTESYRLLAPEEHERREAERAQARAVKAAEARLLAALRDFGVAAWALAQPQGRLAPGNVEAIEAAVARVEALTVALKEAL